MQMKLRKKLILIFVVFLITISSNVVFAAAAPLSESYWILDEAHRSNIVSDISTMGYDGHTYMGTNAYYVRRTMNLDALFFVSAHGLELVDSFGNFIDAGGAIACGGNTYLSANAVVGNDSFYSLQAHFNNTTTALSSIRFAYYSACYSAKTGPWGNLCQKTTQLGALSALGYTTEVGISQCDYFDGLIYGYLAQGYSVQDSANKALARVSLDYNGDTAGLENKLFYYRGGTTSSPGPIYLKPASYGN